MQMDAGTIVAGWKQRLITLAENPEYVFRDTPKHLIERHQRRLTTFVGYPEEKVAETEMRLGVRFPTVFRQYLLEMAAARGSLFEGSDVAGIDEFEQFRAKGLELLAETDSALSLPPEAVVFLLHQGYLFVYLHAAGGFDCAPMQWTAIEREPQQVAATFAEMVDAELRLMESNNRALRKSGGHYLTVCSDGSTKRVFPARASGERPLG